MGGVERVWFEVSVHWIFTVCLFGYFFMEREKLTNSSEHIELCFNTLRHVEVDWLVKTDEMIL